MRSLVWAAAFALVPTIVAAQVWFPPPGPGVPVDFVACPELTAGGSWLATDPTSGFPYSLANAPPPPPNVYVRVSGVVSPQLTNVPGWQLTPLRIVVGRTPCRSAGVPQPSRGFFPVFPYWKDSFPGFLWR